MSVTTLKAPRISGRDRVIVLPNGKVALQSKGRRRYKLSASKRRKIAASLRRFKIPLLTTSAIMLPLSMAVANAGGLNKVFTNFGMKIFAREMLASYTGIYIVPSTGGVLFKPAMLMRGLAPLVAVALINRSGVLKPVNQKLARARIPLRLS